MAAARDAFGNASMELRNLSAFSEHLDGMEQRKGLAARCLRLVALSNFTSFPVVRLRISSLLSRQSLFLPA